jgi:hypothetical protein
MENKKDKKIQKILMKEMILLPERSALYMYSFVKNYSEAASSKE